MKKISSKTSDVFGIWENRADITDDWIDKKKIRKTKISLWRYL
ncbi:MAG: hypothetical protein O2871_03945 [bacterium]|nr:hypothetical protein [bacterium]